IFWSPGRKDYLRRIGVLNSVEKDLPCFRVESKLALLYANLAGLDRGAAGENWRKACDYAAMAMRHAPMDGNFAVLGAEIFSRANSSGARMDSDYSRLKLFLWAYQCIPSKQKALESAAIEAFKYYAKALSIFPEEVPEARQRALGLLVQCIKNNPSSCRKYIPFIAQAAENEAQLMELCSDSVEVRLALAQYFAGMGNYSTSLKIMNQLLAGNGSDNALEYDDEYRLLDRRCGIYRLKGDEERWRLDVEKMKKLCYANKMKLIEEALALVKKAGNQEVVLRLEPLEYINPALPEYIILLAQQYKILGKNSDCLHLLLRLSYVERPPDIKFLLDARDLFVTNDKYHALESEVLRSFFLDAAIEIMLSEKGHASNVHKAINNLERLEGTYQSNSWLQFHLIPFYIARGYECIKEQEKAIEAYRRALKISPNNLYVLRRLGNLTREGLADKQIEILDFANKCKRPLSRVTPNLTFLGFKTSPEFVEALHSNVKLDVRMLCTSDIKAEYHFNMAFNDKKGICFANELDWSKTATPMVSWRVGEVYSHEYEWQPHLMALKGTSRTLEPGDVSVSVSVSVLKQKLRPMPSIVERLWKVK
ncbi:MAG: hypothetical protein IKS20_04970, partial [Victivallales bacterium]|nr:hypothetical protein [Victivallales bacterium]